MSPSPTTMGSLWCVCGHLDCEHDYYDKGKREGQRGKCNTATGPQIRYCPCTNFVLRAAVQRPDAGVT